MFRSGHFHTANITFRIFIRYNYIKANHFSESWCLMYKVHEIVAYSSQGICEITEICQREIAGSVMDYYVMKPLYDSRSTVFVPVSNEKLVSRIRRTMTADEASALLENINSGDIIWVDNDTKRRDLYQSILTEGDPAMLASLFRTLILRKRTLEECSRKLRSTDETCMRAAEKLIARECSYASGEDHEELTKRLNTMIEGPAV